MKTIYMDITNLMGFPFMTGIQRVVSEIAIRLMVRQKTEEFRLVLLRHNRDYNFSVCNNDVFMDHFIFSRGRRTDCVTGQTITIDQLEPSSFWLDVDSVWTSMTPRNILYPQLKKRNIQIGVYVHDVIVLTHPQFCSADNFLRYPAYLAAVFDHADYIFTSTEFTKDQIKSLAKELGCERPIRYVVAALGSDFANENAQNGDVDPDVEQIVERGKVLLMVSTLEARKNHKVLLDAFDAGLCEMGYQLVFVGKVGWRVEELLQRIEEHPENGKSLHHLQGISDATLQYLYNNASFVLFSSYIEGYGLATVEALQHGVPTILSDVPVMREVGGEYCDYFDPDSPEQLIEIIRGYEADPKRYEARREMLKNYRAPTWDDCATALLNGILPFRQPVKREHKLEQIVYLSARADDLLRSLPYVEEFMPFIKRLVLLCPDKMVPEMERRYEGRLSVTYITDSDLLQGKVLPEDHLCRNFFLRCHAITRPELDDEFLMSDDDYRPLGPVEQEFFIRDDRYQAYYCHDLDEWKNIVSKPTSYDIAMLKNEHFLRENGYPDLQYASHMPQVIRKEWYLDMLRDHPELETAGCDEWCPYFNYAITKHPESFDVRPYVTMSWPERVSSWDPMVIPREFVFENFYDFLYDEEMQFAGMSTQYQGKQNEIFLENEKKRLLSRRMLNRTQTVRKSWRTFENKCNVEWKQFPSFVFCYGEGLKPGFLGLPPYLEMLNASDYTLHVFLMKREASGKWCYSDENIRIGYCWEGGEHYAEAENFTHGGHTAIRIGTPNDRSFAVLQLAYSFDGGQFIPAYQVQVYLKE